MSHTVDVAVTVRNSVDAERAVRAGGGLVGTVSNRKPPRSSPEFIDWPFRSDRGAWRRHRTLVEAHEPKMAVAPDVHDDRPLSRVIEQADELARYADTVIVVPKRVDPQRVPSRFRLGIPYAGEAWSGARAGANIGAYRGRDVHILGGNPSAQYATFAQSPIDMTVRSLDTSRPVLYANYGDVWTLSEGRVNRPDLSLIERVALSVANLVAAWNGSEPHPDLERLNAGRPGFGREDLWHPDDPTEGFVSDDERAAERRRVPGPARLPEYELPDDLADAGGHGEPRRADRAREAYDPDDNEELTEGERKVKELIEDDDDEEDSEQSDLGRWT